MRIRMKRGVKLEDLQYKQRKIYDVTQERGKQFIALGYAEACGPETAEKTPATPVKRVVTEPPPAAPVGKPETTSKAQPAA